MLVEYDTYRTGAKFEDLSGSRSCSLGKNDRADLFTFSHAGDPSKFSKSAFNVTCPRNKRMLLQPKRLRDTREEIPKLCFCHEAYIELGEGRPHRNDVYKALVVSNDKNRALKRRFYIPAELYGEPRAQVRHVEKLPAPR